MSGGNTLLFAIHPGNKFAIIARTVDDAAGEALDKGAKLLGLGFPGGPAIEERAASGNPDAFQFPRAFYHTGEKKFSFSGLKTSLRYRLEKMDDAALESSFSDLCASYQEAVVDALARKTGQILNSDNFASLGLSGGVANNGRDSALRWKRPPGFYLSTRAPTRGRDFERSIAWPGIQYRRWKWPSWKPWTIPTIASSTTPGRP